MSKKGWIILAVVLGGGGCCLMSGLALVALGWEEADTSAGSAAPAVAGGAAQGPAADLVGSWDTTSLGLQPYDTATGTWGPLNAEGQALTLRADGTFERVWVKTFGGSRIGTWQSGTWTLEDGLLTLEVEESKTTAGGTPATEWKFAASLTRSGDWLYLTLQDQGTGLKDEFRRHLE